MAHILGAKDRVRPWGTVLGNVLGEGIGKLAEAKIETMRERNEAKQWVQAGADPVTAQIIARMPPERRWDAFTQYAQGRSSQQEQEAPGIAALQQQMVGGQQQPQLGQLPQADISQLLSSKYSSPVAPEHLQQMLQAPQPQQRGGVQQLQQVQSPQAQQQAMAQQAQPIVKEEASLLKSLGTAGKVSRKEEFEREKAIRKEKSEANKATQKYYDEIINAEKAAKESDTDLKKMSKLIEKGKLPPATLYKSLKDAEESLSSFGGAAKSIGAGAALGFATGGPLGAAVGAGAGLAVSPIATMALYGVRNTYPDTEEFEKLSNGFIKYAKSIFGARITDQDLKAFLSTVPTLANTEHGKKAIIHNMDLFNKAVHAKYDVMREIVKENGGNRPPDLALQVQDRLDERLDKLAEEFEESAESSEASALIKRV